MSINKFLTELRDSADLQYKIFTEGSCFRLYIILKVVYKNAKVYWSDRDNHAITKINKRYYDIGGEISPKYIKEAGYYRVPKKQEKGYKILKWVDSNTTLGAKPEKYI